jgi:translation initiation factor 4G
MSRGGSRRGGQRGDEATQDGWNVAGPSVTRVPNNLTNFGKIGKTTAAQTPSNPFDVYTKKGTKARDAAPTLSRAQSSANMFSALNPEAPADLPPTTPSSRTPSRKPSLDLGSGGVPDTPAVRKKLVLAPRTIPAEAAEERVAEQQEKCVDGDKSAMTVAQAETKIEEDIKEFWNSRNIEEAGHYFTALSPEHRHLLVTKLASSALDKKEDDVKLVAGLFSNAAGALCSEDAFETGLSGIIESVDDLSVDVPKAYSFVARLLVGSKLPRTKVEELSNKIIFDGDPLTPPPKRLTREYEGML